MKVNEGLKCIESYYFCRKSMTKVAVYRVQGRGNHFQTGGRGTP